MDGIEFVTDRQWDGCALRIERKNRREHGQSLTCTAISSRAHDHIVEIRSDQGGMLVRKGWRAAMKQD